MAGTLGLGMPRWNRPKPGSECEGCFGCGHLCERCGYPVNACIEGKDCNDLDTESIEVCKECGGTGVRPPEGEVPNATA